MRKVACGYNNLVRKKNDCHQTGYISEPNKKLKFIETECSIIVLQFNRIHCLTCPQQPFAIYIYIIPTKHNIGEIF